MSLSDRLQRARAQQLIDAGVLPHDHGPAPAVQTVEVVEVIEPDAPVETPAQGLFAPVIIEARPVGLHLVAQATVDLTDRPEHDDNALCPTCNTVGIADMVDLVGHTVHYTCGSCSTMWHVRKPVIPHPIDG